MYKEKYLQLFEEVIFWGKELNEKNLVVATWGNISVKIPETDHVVLTPSGMSYQDLTVNDLVVLDLKGNKIEGERKVTSEYEMHLEIYRNRVDIKAIIHTHSNSASAFAVARRSIPAITEEMCQLIGGEISIAAYGQPGTKDLARQVTEELDSKQAVLMANHGVVAAGDSLTQAFVIAQLVEKSADVYMKAKIVGKPYIFSQKEIKGLRESFLANYGQNK